MSTQTKRQWDEGKRENWKDRDRRKTDNTAAGLEPAMEESNSRNHLGWHGGQTWEGFLRGRGRGQSRKAGIEDRRRGGQSRFNKMRVVGGLEGTPVTKTEQNAPELKKYLSVYMWGATACKEHTPTVPAKCVLFKGTTNQKTLKRRDKCYM